METRKSEPSREHQQRLQAAKTPRPGGGKYEPPRIEKGRRLVDVAGGTTNGGGVVPSGAPVQD